MQTPHVMRCYFGFNPPGGLLIPETLKETDIVKMDGRKTNNNVLHGDDLNSYYFENQINGKIKLVGVVKLRPRFTQSAVWRIESKIATGFAGGIFFSLRHNSGGVELKDRSKEI